ncbi:MAG TPA: condensation domain-containing protein [Rhizomicrobium sp.]|nr:condensation domain-containing protein [Rhizomicrobium sp.]
MTIAELIVEMESRGIVLSLSDDEVRYRSPKNALTVSDKDHLRARRAEVVAYLNARDAAHTLRMARADRGPLTPSVAQEMWRLFAGGKDEGLPVALNVGMVDRLAHDAELVTAAIQQVVARHEALRARFELQGNELRAFLNPAESFVVEREDLRNVAPDSADEVAIKGAQAFCARVNLIEGQWLTRAKVFALPNGESVVALSSSHMVSDAGTRNIIRNEIHDTLDHGGPRAAPSVRYNDYSLAEREFLASPQGAQLIAYWRRWYEDQPTMKAPSNCAPMLWGNGIRIVKQFTIPYRILEQVRVMSERWKVTPFFIYLTIFSIAISRWSGMERFPLRVLGDKRISLELSSMVGLMFCADAMEIHAPAQADFETTMRGIFAEYDAALALRIPTLHCWAPQCVRPQVEAPDYPNRIPAVFNYFRQGAARTKAPKKAVPDTSTHLPWPPQLVTLPPQIWPRRSSPLFLHVIDSGYEAAASLHFFQGAVSPPDQESFTKLLFQVFAETVNCD